MTRKVLSTVLAVAMVLSMLAGITLSANAAEINTTFTKVTDIADVTSGEYLIVESNIAMVSTEDTTSTFTAQSGELTVENGVITYDGTVVPAAAIWTLTKDAATGNYTIADKNGSYLATVSGKNQAVLSETAEAATITASDAVEGAFIIEQAGRFLGHNNGYSRYAYYGSVQNASVHSHLELYKAGVEPCAHEHTENVAEVPATCTEAGVSAGVRCTDCGAILSGCAAIPALGHDYVDGICSRCGAEEPVVVDYSGRYYIAAIRSSGNYQYMTGNLTSGNTQRYAAVDSGVETLPAEITAPEAINIFTVAKSGDVYTIVADGVEGDNYLGWTSGNSGALVDAEHAANVTISEVDGAIHIDLGTERSLALNSSESNNYFAWYQSGTTMITALALVPVTGAVHTHTWDEGVVTTEPSCTEDGVRTFTCSICGATRTEPIEALGHNYVDGICSRCGAQEPVAVDYSGRYAIIALRSNGYFYLTGTLTSGSTKRYTAVAAELETLPEEISEPAENGVFVIEKSGDGYKISVEGLEGENYLGWTTGNSGALVAAEDAPVVLISEGTETGSVNIAIENSDRILSLNNTTTANYFAWYAGTQINDLYLVPVSENAHTHSWDEGVVTTEPSCTEDGVKTYTCSVCNETRTEVIPALGHDYVDGICSRCGAEEPVVDFSGKYYFAAKRNSGNFFYMTGVLTDTSTTRYTAVDSELETLPAAITEPEAAHVFVIAKSGAGYTIAVDGTNNYLGWTSGNSGTLVTAEDAAIVAIADNGDGTVTITFTDRNLALNNTAGNNYFAWYTSAQANHITLIPVTGDVPVHTHTIYHYEGDAATCDHVGYKAYYTCTDPTCPCYNKMYEDEALTVEFTEIIIPALGHDYRYTDNGNGTHTVTCSRCDYTATEDHSFTDGHCVCGATEGNYDAALKFLSHNLNLQSYIGVDYTISTTKALRDKYSEFSVVAEFDGTQVTLDLLRSATSYKVYELKTTATQMTEDITATIYAVSKTDGETYRGETLAWSVREGIMDMLRAETDAARRQLEVDMLKYGAAAQIVFGKNVDNLADSELGDYAQYGTSTNPTIAATTSTSGSGVAFRTKSLSLASSIEMQFMFSYKNLTLSNLEARIVHDGETKIVPITAATSTYAGFSYEGLASNELRKNITVAVYDKTTGQPVTQILTVSVEALAAEKLDSYAGDAARLELLNAVMRYGDSAQAVYGD